MFIWKICTLEQQKVVSESFACTASKWSLYDAMFCAVLAAAEINLFKGSLYYFANVTQGFLWQHTLQTSQSNLIQGIVVHKAFKLMSS